MGSREGLCDQGGVVLCSYKDKVGNISGMLRPKSKWMEGNPFPSVCFKALRCIPVVIMWVVVRGLSKFIPT